MESCVNKYKTIISSETIDARGEQIKNVGYPTDLSDAITM